MKPQAAKLDVVTIRKSRKWRYSLRTLFVLMTVAGTVLAPISVELYRSRIVARQASAIRESNGNYLLGPPRDDWSAWLAIKLIPWRNEFLGREIQGVTTSRDEFDLPTLEKVPQLRDLKLFGPIKVRDRDFTHAGVTSLDLGVGTDYKFGSSLVNGRILSRFPQVEEVNLPLVPANQSLIDDLGGCSRLQRLKIVFAHPDIRGQRPPNEMPLIDFAPLDKLKSLRRLQVIHVASATDWSFLAKLPALEEVTLTPTGFYTFSNTLQSWEKHYGPVPPREQSPFHYLCNLRALKKVELFDSPAYADDIQRLVNNSPIEELRLDILPDGLDSLKGLRNAKFLRKLHVTISFLGNDSAAAQEMLSQLPLDELTLGHPYDNVR